MSATEGFTVLIAAAGALDEQFIAAFNSGDVDAMAALYATGGVCNGSSHTEPDCHPAVDLPARRGVVEAPTEAVRDGPRVVAFVEEVVDPDERSEVGVSPPTIKSEA